MSRNTGTFNFAANFEGLIKAPIDAKQLVSTYADLTNPASWCASGQVWLYNGAMVVVGSDPIPANNGIYWLCDATNYTMTCSWKKAGSGSGAGTVSGATNGLRLINSGTTVVLGGNLSSGTTINGLNSYELNLINLLGFHVSGGTTEIILEPAGITLSHSGTSVNLDSNAGLTYNGDYSPNYTIRSLPDVGFVTGLTSGLKFEINYISGVTDTKLAKVTFSAYTASTTAIISNAVTGATNGLTKSGRNIGLGGTLTGNTIIDGNSHDFYLCNARSILLCSTGAGYSTSICGYNTYLWGDNLTEICSPQIAIGFDTTGFVYDNAGTKRGLLYGGNYDATFCNNSLVDKCYVDTVATGLEPKLAVWVATTGTCIVLNGLQTIDGISVASGCRVLVKNQSGVTTPAAQNGIYVASSGAWTRSPDFNGTPQGEISQGALVPVITGSTNRNTLWVLITPDPITGGTTPLLFSPFSTPGNYTGANGVCVSGTVICLDAMAQAVRLYGITGVTNCGGGTSICKSISGHNFCIDTFIGSGGTSVQKVGDEIIICSTTASGSQQYSGQTPSAVNLCGITIGYQLTGKTVSCILQDLLVPELYQTSVGTPSTSVGGTLSGTLEIGCSFSQTITPTYTAGAITPLYCSTSPFTRGGAANDYSYSGPSVSPGFNGCTSCVINPYVVTSGGQTWCVCTKYNQGSCIKGSKGTVNPSYPTACPLNSCTAYGSASITGILPWYWGTSALGSISGSDVANGNKVLAVVGASTPITFNAVAEFLWFAAPTGTYTTKTKWWVCSANAGDIGGSGNLWKEQGTVAVTSISGCWAGCSFDVYVTCGITTTAPGIPMCLYY
jgi:hypothetical protein